MYEHNAFNIELHISWSRFDHHKWFYCLLHGTEYNYFRKGILTTAEIEFRSTLQCTRKD